MAKPLKGPSLIDDNGVVLHRDGKRPAKVVRLDENGVNKGGKPLIYNTVEELEADIDAYFDSDEKMDVVTKRGYVVEISKPWTVEGLANFLKCSARDLRNYEKRDNYFPVIHSAKQKIFESWIVNGLVGNHDPRLVQFVLSVNNTDYNISKQVDVTAITIEDKLRIIKEQRELNRIESAKQIERGGENGEGEG